MKKERILQELKGKGFIQKHLKHKALFTMEEAKIINQNHDVAKNLFLKDKRNYYFLTYKGNEKVSLKHIESILETKNLHFATIEQTKKYFGIEKGELTPLNLLTTELDIHYYLDIRFKDGYIGMHPFTNQETIWLKTEDFEVYMKENGVNVHYILPEGIL